MFVLAPRLHFREQNLRILKGCSIKNFCAGDVLFETWCVGHLVVPFSPQMLVQECARLGNCREERNAAITGIRISRREVGEEGTLSTKW